MKTKLLLALSVALTVGCSGGGADSDPVSTGADAGTDPTETAPTGPDTSADTVSDTGVAPTSEPSGTGTSTAPVTTTGQQMTSTGPTDGTESGSETVSDGPDAGGGTDSEPARDGGTPVDTTADTGSDTGSDTVSDTVSDTGSTTSEPVEPSYTEPSDRLTAVLLDGGDTPRGGWDASTTPVTVVPDVFKFERTEDAWTLHVVMNGAEGSEHAITKDMTANQQGFRVDVYTGLGFFVCGSADGLVLEAVDTDGVTHAVSLPAVADTWSEVRVPWASVVTLGTGEHLNVDHLVFRTGDASVDLWIQGLQHYDAGKTLHGTIPSGPCPEYVDGPGID